MIIRNKEKYYDLNEEIRLNPITQLGKKGYAEWVEQLSPTELQTALSHTKSVAKIFDRKIIECSVAAIGSAVMYRFGPDIDILRNSFLFTMIAESALGALGVYGKRAYMDAISVINLRLNHTSTPTN